MRSLPSTRAGALRTLLQCAATATLLSGCGGGGSAADSAAPSAAPAGGGTPANPAPPSPAPVSTTPTAAVATCGLPDFEASLLARVNQVRATSRSCGSSGNFTAAAALTWSTQLTQAAQGHSQDMAANDYFDHVSLDGRTLSQRVNATGYAWSSLGENIAAGYATVNEVVDGWVASPGHCANLMNPNFNQFGVACVLRVGSSRYSNYWTMDLARSR